ncbi:hypothetical protein SAMN05216378_4336 [Paenibacillus catalpae]|uniref:Uncharacterized protein n=1 Tax=Paenibacillus catalpae TaxID=1045775 RepID=A0A1I2DZJ2_9BACL|nr:hypothetical protein [Paenibacillus catalpae]SFE85390.1 hypothetical protein SAMN05216378_4336 [Paenibacillus catalpae]
MQVDRLVDTKRIMLVGYSVLLVLTARWAFAADERLSLILYCGLLLPFFVLMRWPNAPVLLMASFTATLAGKAIYAATVNPLAGPDEIHYYEQVTTFEKLSQFMPYAIEQIQSGWMNISAYPVFGLMYMPFYKWLELDDPLAIILFNTVLLILIVNSSYRLNDSRFAYALPDPDNSRQPFMIISVIGLMLSPSLMYMSSLFAKDITCVWLGLLGALLLLQKRWLLFLIVILYATGLRDYAVIYTLCFYFLYTQRIRTAVCVMLAAAGLLFMQIGPLGIINAVMLSIFLFISPNPMNFSNWEPELLLRTLEAVFMGIVLMISVYQAIVYKETRKFYLMAALLIFTYACALVLVGYVTITGRELDYGVGTIGDNMVRKKLPVLPLLYTIAAYAMVWCRKIFILKHRKIQSLEAEQSRELKQLVAAPKPSGGATAPAWHERLAGGKGSDGHAGTRTT